MQRGLKHLVSIWFVLTGQGHDIAFRIPMPYLLYMCYILQKIPTLIWHKQSSFPKYPNKDLFRHPGSLFDLIFIIFLLKELKNIDVANIAITLW